MKRFYRDYHSNEGYVRFVVSIEESDLLIVVPKVAETSVLRSEAIKEIQSIRRKLERHIKEVPAFLTSLVPLTYDGDDQLLQRMYFAAEKAGVGPMAAVAGITSEYVGTSLKKTFGAVDILVENGGDLFLDSNEVKKIAIHAGASPLSDKLSLQITPDMMPLGICTSAGTIGHSLSFGKADAMVVLSKDTALADAVATAAGNRVKECGDIEDALEFAMAIDGVLGVVCIIGDRLGAAGQVTLV